MEFVVKDFCELQKDELYEILKARAQIFIVEKGMNCQDLDGIDFYAKHFILRENGNLIAYLRGFCDGEWYKLGRIITLSHGIGHGRILMEKSLEYISENLSYKSVYINSQYDAAGFYKKCGFVAVGEEFIEENVRHIRMERKEIKK